MKKKIITYIIAICIIFLASIYTNNYELMFLAFFIAILPLLDYIFIKQSANRLGVAINVKNVMIKKGDTIPIETRVNNKGILPVVMIEFNFICENKLHNTNRNINLRFPVLRWGKQECIFKIKSMYCGDIKITLESVKCLDYFGLFSKKVDKKFSKRVYILPDKNNLDILKIDNHSVGDVEGIAFSKYKPGDDPSEVFDIREYRPGDKIHSIHWKLSARKEQFMVKEFSYPINSNYSIIMDLTSDGKNRDNEIDSVIEVTTDVIVNLQERGIRHQIIAYDRNSKGVYKEIIDIDDTIVDIMYKLYQSTSYSNRDLLYDYDMRNETNDETVVIYICSYINADKLEAFDRIFRQASKVYIYLYNEGEEISRELEELNEVKVVGINIDKIKDDDTNIQI